MLKGLRPSPGSVEFVLGLTAYSVREGGPRSVRVIPVGISLRRRCIVDTAMPRLRVCVKGTSRLGRICWLESGSIEHACRGARVVVSARPRGRPGPVSVVCHCWNYFDASSMCLQLSFLLFCASTRPYIGGTRLRGQPIATVSVCRCVVQLEWGPGPGILQE